MTIQEFLNLIIKVDSELDRDRHAHSGDYRDGWDDCIIALINALKERSK
jgi:hypothetical protein